MAVEEERSRRRRRVAVGLQERLERAGEVERTLLERREQGGGGAAGGLVVREPVEEQERAERDRVGDRARSVQRSADAQGALGAAEPICELAQRARPLRDAPRDAVAERTLQLLRERSGGDGGRRVG